MVAMIAPVNSIPMTDQAFMTRFLLPIPHWTLLERGRRTGTALITHLFSILENDLAVIAVTRLILLPMLPHSNPCKRRDGLAV
jgi:hypothetical protein